MLLSPPQPAPRGGVRGGVKSSARPSACRPLPPALPKHRTLIGIMRSPSKNNNRRRSYCPIRRHLFCPSCSQHGPIVASRCPRWNLGGANMVSRWPTCAHKELNIALESAKIRPRWQRWSQDGARMAPRWSKTRQHEPKRSLTCPKRAPRSPR